jgi:L-ascorbate metabolism protein UlaG (beta-lactamase superfamily)
MNKTLVIITAVLSVFALALGGLAMLKTSLVSLQTGENPLTSAEIAALKSDLAAVKTNLPPTWGGWPSNGYVVKVKEGPTIYFPGDTDVTLNWDAIREVYHPDIVVGTDAVLYQNGLEEWIYAVNHLKPKYVLASHHGSFPFYPQTDEEWVKGINEKTDAEAVPLPAPGQEFTLMGVKFTWLGHSAFVIETPQGTRIGTDPEWHAANIKNYPEEFKTAEKYAADMILVTHGHYDHYDPQALKTLIAPASGHNPYIVMLFEFGAYVRKAVPELSNKILMMNLGGRFDKNILSQAYGVSDITHLDDIEFIVGIAATHSSGVFSPL